MAKATFTVKVTELPKVQLLVWELRSLEDDMRVGASPFAERLTRLLDRFSAPSDDTDYGPPEETPA